MKKIVFQNKDKTIGIHNPSPRILNILSLIEVGEKSTPKGLPFWIVDEFEIPSDRSNRDAWELDGTQGDPDGYGE